MPVFVSSIAMSRSLPDETADGHAAVVTCVAAQSTTPNRRAATPLPSPPLLTLAHPYPRPCVAQREDSPFHSYSSHSHDLCFHSVMLSVSQFASRSWALRRDDGLIFFRLGVASRRRTAPGLPVAAAATTAAAATCSR